MSDATPTDPIRVRPVTEADRSWVPRFLETHAVSGFQVTRGRIHQADTLPGFAAFEGDSAVGLATYLVDGAECAVVTLHVADQWRGVGTALLNAVRDHARESACTRLWLVTTNDNVDALRFYQRRGLRVIAVHAGAVDKARRTLKPEIPQVGDHGIPTRDEIELEQRL